MRWIGEFCSSVQNLYSALTFTLGALRRGASTFSCCDVQLKLKCCLTVLLVFVTASCYLLSVTDCHSLIVCVVERKAVHDKDQQRELFTVTQLFFFKSLWFSTSSRPKKLRHFNKLCFYGDKRLLKVSCHYFFYPDLKEVIFCVFLE